jgi:predicted kinase
MKPPTATYFFLGANSESGFYSLYDQFCSDREDTLHIIKGGPGTGKSTLAAQLARDSALEKSIHLHTDDFYHYLSKGYIPPYMPESNEQNRIVIDAILATATRFAQGGYDVLVDGITGPWFLAPWVDAARAGTEVHYIVLRAAEEETLRRTVARDKLDRETNTAVVKAMWQQFAALGEYERHAVDTTALTAAETLLRLQAILAAGSCLLA